MPLPWLWSVKSKQNREYFLFVMCVSQTAGPPRTLALRVSRNAHKLNPWCRKRTSSPVITGGEQDAWPVQIKLFLSPPRPAPSCDVDADLLSDCSEYTSYMPSRRIPPTALFSFLSFSLVVFTFSKHFLFLSLFFFYRGFFSILLHSIAHNLTNVKCTAAWLVQPFKHEPGRYRSSFQQQQKNKNKKTRYATETCCFIWRENFPNC